MRRAPESTSAVLTIETIMTTPTTRGITATATGHSVSTGTAGGAGAHGTAGAHTTLGAGMTPSGVRRTIITTGLRCPRQDRPTATATPTVISHRPLPAPAEMRWQRAPHATARLQETDWDSTEVLATRNAPPLRPPAPRAGTRNAPHNLPPAPSTTAASEATWVAVSAPREALEAAEAASTEEHAEADDDTNQKRDEFNTYPTHTRSPHGVCSQP